MATNYDSREKNVCVLIDAENISPSYITYIIDEANKQGNIAFRYIYGDWSESRLKAWKDACIDYSLVQKQEYSPVKGKSSSDFALVIDAMDILYRDTIDTFILVSSDSDFTRLVNRLREGGCRVIGMGESKTPRALANSCHTFVYLDKIKQADEKIKEKRRKSKPSPVKKDENTSNEMASLDEILDDVRSIINDTLNDEGWAYWSNTYNLLLKKQPSFDPRNYNFPGKPLKFFEQHGFVTKRDGLDVLIKSDENILN